MDIQDMLENIKDLFDKIKPELIADAELRDKVDRFEEGLTLYLRSLYLGPGNDDYLLDAFLALEGLIHNTEGDLQYRLMEIERLLHNVAVELMVL